MRATKGAQWITLARYETENTHIVSIPYSLTEMNRLRKRGYHKIDDYRMEKSGAK